MFNKSGVFVSLEEYLRIYLSLYLIQSLSLSRACFAQSCDRLCVVSVRGQFPTICLCAPYTLPCCGPCIATVRLHVFYLGFFECGVFGVYKARYINFVSFALKQIQTYSVMHHYR